MARYQLRLNRRNGRTARATNVLASISFRRMPLKNASGSQMSEQMAFQKLSRMDSLLMNASILSYVRSKKLRAGRAGRRTLTGVPWTTASWAVRDVTPGAARATSSIASSAEMALVGFIAPSWGFGRMGLVVRVRLGGVTDQSGG